MNIHTLELLTHDLEATRVFYHNQLGLKIHQEKTGSISFRLPGSVLVFHLAENSKPLYHIAFNIPHNQTMEALEWMNPRASIIPVDEKNMIADFSNWNADAFYFSDLNGNILEFIARRDLRNSSDTIFESRSILSVSETGIVTNNVKATCDYIKEKFGIDYFDKQPPHENFAAMGDDEGLFIVVNNHRPWYPTQILSSVYWLKISFSHNGMEHIYEHIPEKL